ncbi:MAG TPA: amino acid adenylation domain-containing protein [Pyrinomonadaceae bacterium]
MVSSKQQHVGTSLNEHEAYWTRHFSKQPAPLELPFSNPRPAVPSFIRAQEAIELRQSLQAGLRKFCFKENVTLFETLLAALEILLFRYTGQTDIVIGSVSVNSVSDVDKQTRLVNPIPLRTSLGGNPTARTLLNRVAFTVEGAAANRDYPFSALLDAVNSNESYNRAPLFQVMLVPCQIPECISEIPISREHLNDIAEYTTRCDLVVVAEIHSTLTLSCEYDADLFDKDSILRMLGHFQTLLENIVADPNCGVSALSILTEAEQHQLLVAWNDVEQPYQNEQCLHQLVEIQAERTPDAVAVAYQQEQFTYRELNQKANQLARYLRRIGVGPEVRVGVCLPRSFELVLGLLGILKTGAAYVPLDPTYPRKRLDVILSDARVSVLLTQKNFDMSLPDRAARVVCLDTNWNSICAERTENINSGATSENLAYVMYTSGSTGKPKGTMVTHRGLVNYLNWCEKAYAVASGSGAPVNSSTAFDATITSLWSPLIVGQRVLMLPEQEEIEALSEALRSDYNFSLIKITPSLLDLLNRLLPAEEMRAQIGALVIGGEALFRKSLTSWITHAPKTRLINEFGPTESVVGCCVYEIPPASSLPESIPIGRPIANTQLYILDQFLQPVPLGIPGELHIGGAGLARGYLDLADLTASKFIPNPFSDAPGARLYRTGDLARYRPDGNIEFLGRLDHQVKIRGFRVELGEIEMTLRQHPDVRDAVVVTWKETGPTSPSFRTRTDKCLVAYVVPNARQAVTSNELSSFLQELLPSYMQPTTFVMLPEFPLTPNGKVDRHALPSPDKAHYVPERAFTPPRTPNEQILTRIWAKALGLTKVGVDDNFFELGGDSILAIQIITQANQAGLQFTRKQLFEHKTIARLAAVTNTIALVQAEQGLITGPVPLTPIQHWFFELSPPDPNQFSQSVQLRVPSSMKPSQLAEAVGHLLDYHDALRLRFVHLEDGWQQVNTARGEIPFSVVDLSDLTFDEQQVTLKSAVDSVKASLNLADGPVVRVVFFTFGVRRPGHLLWVIHHVGVDAISWRILLEDLHTAYEQVSRESAIRLPLKTTSFKCWAERLQAYGQSSTLATELNYWLEPPQRDIAHLPQDYSGSPANTLASVEQLTVSLDQKQTRTLLQALPRVYNTRINDVLLAALALAWPRDADERDLLIDLEGHGREELFPDIDLSRTVGWFTTVFPVRLALPDKAHPEKVLKSVRNQLRRVPNQGIGYGLLRYLARDETARIKLSSMPQAELSLNYLGQLDQILSETPLFEWAQESIELNQGVCGLRRYLLEITGFVAGDRLHFIWSYSRNIHKRARIEGLAQRFIEALTSLSSHSQVFDGYMSSDFPAARLKPGELDRFTTSLQHTNREGLVGRIEDIYELTSIQHGLLFHALSSPKSGVYFEQFVCRIRGHLNVPAFKSAWQEVMKRNGPLRTAFFWRELDKPLQATLEGVEATWTMHDWRGLSAVEQQEQLETFLQMDRVQGFNLDQAPLMRCALAQTNKDTHEWIWSYHHLLLDRWSMALLIKEFLTIYRAISQSQSVSLRNPRPYRAYVSWLQQQNVGNAEVFWKQELLGITSPTPLVVDHGGKNVTGPNENYAEQEHHLSPSATAALQRLAQQHDLTLNTLLQGAWALLLSRYSGHEDVVFGATLSERSPELAGVEAMVGLFINTVPIRVHVPGRARLIPWLQQLQTRQLERERYAHSALVEIHGWSSVPRGMSLFESIVVFENYPIDVSREAQDSNLEIDNVRIFERTNYPLTLIVVPRSALELRLSYKVHHFDSATIARMLGHLATLLENFAAYPDRCLADFPLLTQSERQQLLVTWNDTAHTFSHKQCLHGLFEAQARQTPDAVAIGFGIEQLTYRELNCRANQLARYLKRLGVGPEVLVGLNVERSTEMVIGILGILKASGAYLPLDPTYPEERLAFVLSDGQVPVLLTQEHLIKRLPGNDAKLICLDKDWPTIARESEQDLASAVDPTNLAYVLYTSGSTGSPKGVTISHHSAVALLDWARITFTHEQVDGVLASTSICFDLSIFELFVPLSRGAKVILVENALHLPGSPAAETVTLVNTVPSAMAELLRVDGIPSSVNSVILAGEPLQNKLVQEIYERKHISQVFNLYGPSEDATYSTGAVLTKGTDEPPSIGRPIANKQVYLLDAHLEPVPIGVVGELHIGGNGLARGYLNRPDLTAERFIPNPFSNEPGRRLYKTGDLSRYRTDGNIDFLGRIDHQVKVRGFRIELGEIEAVLSQHPAVRETVVLARSNAPDDSSTSSAGGDQYLVAYVVGRRDQQPAIRELRNFLQKKLPRYMVPSVFVLLDVMPLLPNGKIDRQALTAPEHVRDSMEVTFVAPKTPVEQRLARIWSEVLAVDTIGSDDNFFELGGHSLKATMVISRVLAAFKVDIPFDSLSRVPTIAGLANVIEQARQSGAGLQLPPVVPLPRDKHILKASS